MELEPGHDRQTDAKMWIEVDLAGIMRAAPGLFKGSIQRVSDREMAAIKAAVESTAGRRGVLDGVARFYRDAIEIGGAHREPD
jgi:hypothetical protein